MSILGNIGANIISGNAQAPVLLIKNPCDERDEKKNELKTLTREFRINVKECEESLYGSFIEKYFTINDGTHLTHYSLL